LTASSLTQSGLSSDVSSLYSSLDNLAFDKEFNAITGLNGSGKSNILDAICFVLGITQLGHMRAEKLQELVYKAGNSGVTKATVTIKFDNTNKL
jgi:structural maintenance of chromosome 2